MQRISSKRFRQPFLACLAGMVCLLSAFPAVPGDGRIPVYEPIVITQSGSYVVTRDITGGDVIIDIQSSATEVTVDLNGFTLETSSNGPVVRAQGTPGATRGSVTILNGRLVAATTARDVPLTVNLDDLGRGALGHVDANGKFVFYDISTVGLDDVTASAVSVNGSLSSPVTGSITNSRFVNADGVALEIVNGSAVLVKSVSIEKPGGDGMRVNNCDACQFSGVAVQDAAGKGVSVESTTGSRFHGGTIIRSGGIGLFIDNTSQGNSFTDFTASFAQGGNVGIEDQGSQSHFNGVVSHGNSGGGMLMNGSQATIRNSVSQGNAPPNYSNLGFSTYVEPESSVLN